jgi:hypothetical protein
MQSRAHPFHISILDKRFDYFDERWITIVTDQRRDFIKRSWETAIFLNSMIIYNDLVKTERGEMVADIMKSVSKIILDLMCNDTFLKELKKGD